MNDAYPRRDDRHHLDGEHGRLEEVELVSRELVISLSVAVSVLTFVTFFMKEQVRLRQCALMTNALSLVLALGNHLWPQVILFVALIPLNTIRLREYLSLHKRVEAALTGEVSIAWLRPFMQQRAADAGTVLFRRGDEGDRMYYVVSGSVRLEEFNVVLAAGTLFGEIALFSPNNVRTASAVCAERTLLLEMGRKAMLELYYKNPEFGMYLIRLITERLLDDLTALRAHPADAAPVLATEQG